MYTETWEDTTPDLSALLAFVPPDEIAYNRHRDVYDDQDTAEILYMLRRRRPAPDKTRTA